MYPFKKFRSIQVDGGEKDVTASKRRVSNIGEEEVLHNNTAKKRRRRGEVDDVVDDDDDKNATQEDDESFDINDFISNVS